MICNSINRSNPYQRFLKIPSFFNPTLQNYNFLISYNLFPPILQNPDPNFQDPDQKSKTQASSSAAQDLFQQSLSQLPPRFTTQDLSKALSLQRDPNACLLLFNWASQQPRFRHDVSTFLIMVKKLGADQLLDEFDAVVSQALSLSVTSETLFNTIIYFYTESRKLSKAVSVYKHMKGAETPIADLLSGPTICSSLRC